MEQFQAPPLSLKTSNSRDATRGSLGNDCRLEKLALKALLRKDE